MEMLKNKIQKWFNETPHDMGKEEFDALMKIIETSLIAKSEPVATSPAAMAGSISKPPIGLKPRWVNDIERGIEISQACMRYIAERKEIPSEWLQELEEISSRIEK